MQQIADWLEKLGLGQDAQQFAENDINFTILSDLSDQDLKELGVSSLGHRRQLLRATAELNIQTSPPMLATAAPASVATQAHDTAERRRSMLGYGVREIISRRRRAAAEERFRNELSSDKLCLA